MLPVTQAYLNLPTNLTINLNEFYEGGRFIEEPALENLIRLHGNINYRIGGNTRIKLMSICKYILGQGTHHDGVKRVFGETAPLLYPNPPIYSSSNISNLMGKTKKGSQTFRKSLMRNHDFITKLEKWKKTLGSDDLEEDTIPSR